MNDTATENSTTTLSVKEYYSEDFFEKEKKAVWSNSWLLAGRVGDLSKPGDFIVFEVAVIETSILIIYGKDNKLRAFYNACVHQGARLSYESKGSCSRLRCSFHGWNYNFEGKLTGVPFQELFPGLEVDKLRMKEVNLETWGGFIFIHPGENPQHSLHETLQSMPPELEAYLAKEDWQWHAGYKGQYKANWKIFVDNQCEGHHANFLHSKSIGGYFELEDIPHTVFPESSGVMSKIEVSRPKSSSDGAVKQTEVSKIAAKFSKHGMWTEKDGSAVAHKYEGALNRKKCDRWVFDLYVLFPNVVFLFEDDQFVIQRIWPIKPNLTSWELDHFYVGKPKNFGELFNRELSLLQQMDTASEDTSVSEGIHRNYSCGAIDKAYLSDLQKGMRAFQQKIRTMVKEAK
ncbi:MAG: phenylpropionate dioxygenase-like ring-hydroxylating dioxygenase large terminal subunit [Gammaproteobacteria bacterium]|jgi:phenylpropionate dioxygenase-like ring-hydroxylating dioxygenase large terminal subunit